MTRITTFLFLFMLIFHSCSTESQTDSIEKWKKEIAETEKQFAEMAQNEGISKAFLAFAAKDAVLMRNNKLIIGKEAIKARFDSQPPNNGTLVWAPDFVDVAASGDLGYTYGQYTYTTLDSTGQSQKSKGVFHTVWKRQPDGNWRFVWD